MNKKIITLILLFICCHKTIEPNDCNGVSGGNSIEDNCGICDNDISNDCIQDCADVWGGNSIIDNNGLCCNNWEQDDCEICFGGDTFSDLDGYPCIEGSGADCMLPDGSCDCSGNVLDQCGVCSGNGEPCLDFYIDTDLTCNLGDTLIIVAEVESADYLYALSFTLAYNRDQNGVLLDGTEMFVSLDTGNIIEGDLFTDPFLPTNAAFSQYGEINVVIGEMGAVSPIISGSACIIKLIAIGVGSSYIEINDLNMIESDGTPIEGMSTITVAGLRITVF